MMTPFDIAEGNPGAMTFMLSAYNSYPDLANLALFRMKCNKITGSALYMLWNDCCDRDTKMAVEAALYCPLVFLKDHINKRGGRGIRIEVEDIVKFKNNPKYWQQPDPLYNY